MILRIAPWLTEENRSIISEYELGKRVPSLIEMLNYARLVEVTIDDLVDDAKHLPF